jgi:hypothetical protein
MTCVSTRLNMAETVNTICTARFGFDTIAYQQRCALLRLDTLVKVKRRSIAYIMFIFDILSGRMNSPNLLSAIDLNTPQSISDSGFRVFSNWFPSHKLRGA